MGFAKKVAKKDRFALKAVQKRGIAFNSEGERAFGKHRKGGRRRYLEKGGGPPSRQKKKPWICCAEEKREIHCLRLGARNERSGGCYQGIEKTDDYENRKGEKEDAARKNPPQRAAIRKDPPSPSLP